MLPGFLFAVLSVAAIMAVSLALVRWRTGKLDPPLVLAVLARVTGGLTLALGSAHLLEIAGGLLIGRRPYTLRNVEVLWIGGILVFSGLSNLAVSASLRRAETWAWRASGAVTILVWLFTLSLLPVTTGGTMDSTMNRVLFFMHSLYLLYWATHRLKPVVNSRT
jgi:uncharacterized membrane protein HdeD (DUF308 family)